MAVTLEDSSDYFYRLLLPPVRHTDTICGLPLPGWHVDPIYGDEDGVAHDDAGLYSLALCVVPMGDSKAMEIAQMIHQSLVLNYIVQGWGDTLTYRWRLPAEPHMCLMRTSGYKEESFLRKQALKAACEASEAKFWRAEVSSQIGHIGGDLQKLRLLGRVTLDVMPAPFVTPAWIE
eukprot:372621-Amphidinium_carterae.1